MASDEREANRARPSALERWWAPGLVALAIAAAFVGALLVRADGDASRLVHAAPPWTDPAGARPSLSVSPPDEGFDGQFFYRLGVDPWSTQPEVAGVTFDLPALRNARWGYGALAWAVSLGDADRVPEALIVVNLAAAFAVGAAGGALVVAAGHRRLWGAAFVLWPGFAYSLSMDTSELVASAFVLTALVAARRRRWPLAAGLLAAAVVTRDTTAVVPFGFLVAGLVAASPTPTPRRLAPTAGWVGVGAMGLGAFVGWQAVQRARFGVVALTSSKDSNLAAPFGGLVDLVRTTGAPTTSAEALRVVSAVLIVGLVLATAWRWRRSEAPLAERVAWIPAVVVVAVLNAYLWSGATAFMRATTEAGILSAAVLLAVRDRRIPVVLTASLGIVWALTAVAQLSKIG